MRLLVPLILSHSPMLGIDLRREEEGQKKLDPTMEGTFSKVKKSCARQSRDGTNRRCCRRMSSGYLTHQQVPTTEECEKDLLGR